MRDKLPSWQSAFILTFVFHYIYGLLYEITPSWLTLIEWIITFLAMFYLIVNPYEKYIDAKEIENDESEILLKNKLSLLEKQYNELSKHANELLDAHAQQELSELVFTHYKERKEAEPSRQEPYYL